MFSIQSRSLLQSEKATQPFVTQVFGWLCASVSDYCSGNGSSDWIFSASCIQHEPLAAELSLTPSQPMRRPLSSHLDGCTRRRSLKRVVAVNPFRIGRSVGHRRSSWVLATLAQAVGSMNTERIAPYTDLFSPIQIQQFVRISALDLGSGLFVSN